MAKNSKKRNWAFFIYPSKEYLDKVGTDYDGADGYGTAPENWIEELQKTGLQCAISPLHDKDKLEDGSGRVKKPHWHVIACYSGPTSFNVVKELTDRFNAPIPQALEQIRGYYRYLTHKDNPEKYQYNELDIRTINGFNIADFTELTRSEVTQIKKRLQSLIRELDIYEYADLMDLLQDEERNEDYDVASNNTYFFKQYIDSRRNKGVKAQARGDSVLIINTEMCCPECGSIEVVKYGKTAAESQRWKCKDCEKVFVQE